jgi:hypothetical protein
MYGRACTLNKELLSIKYFQESKTENANYSGVMMVVAIFTGLTINCKTGNVEAVVMLKCTVHL